ncbi:DUF4262 domain-containing protein [Salmonella enterica subsp. enterica]|nr:DUF4262 domain-containing protein [Salmonella enterica subsp. enterica]
MSNTVKLNENNFSKLDDFIEEYIEKKQWAIISVAPDEGSDEPGYMYTVGLTEHGMPEIFVSGYCPALGSAINKLGNFMVKAKTIPLGAFDGDLTLKGTGETLRLDVREIEDIESFNEVYAISAFARYGKKVAGIQLVWPDTSNTLPHEGGYESCCCPQILL